MAEMASTTAGRTKSVSSPALPRLLRNHFAPLPILSSLRGPLPLPSPLDLGGLNDAATKETGAAASAMPETRPFLLARTLTKPVIAAINGPVAGIGLAWSLTCDMRFTNKDSKFSCAFSKRGLVAEWGTSFLLPRLVGTGNAMLYLMSSEVFLGEEATRIGIAQRCFDGDVLERTVTFAKQLAANVSPVSMATMKQQLWRHPLMADDLALHESVQLMKASLTPRNEDFKEGVQSFLEKRQAAFKPLSSENPVRKAAEMLFPAAAPKSRL